MKNLNILVHERSLEPFAFNGKSFRKKDWNQINKTNTSKESIRIEDT